MDINIVTPQRETPAGKFSPSSERPSRRRPKSWQSRREPGSDPLQGHNHGRHFASRPAMIVWERGVATRRPRGIDEAESSNCTDRRDVAPSPGRRPDASECAHWFHQSFDFLFFTKPERELCACCKYFLTFY